MIEDEVLLFLHYLGIINGNDNVLYPNDYIDSIIMSMLKFNEDVGKKQVYKLNNTSTKIKIIKLFLKNDCEKLYIKDCYNIIEKNIPKYL